MAEFVVSEFDSLMRKAWKKFPGKMMVVVNSRFEVVQLTKKINELAGDSFGAFSPFWDESSGRNMTSTKLDPRRKSESEIIRRFADADDRHNLVVDEKLGTGFGAPALTDLLLFKKYSSKIRLFQLLQRLCRILEGKPVP